MDKNKKGKEIAFWGVGAAVIACSFCQYLYNALDDYGLRTNTLNKFIAAQNPETASHDYSSGSCNDVTIMCGQFLKTTTDHVSVKTDAYGVLSYKGLTMSGLSGNTYYWVSLVKTECVDSTWPQNICHKDGEGLSSFNATKGSSSDDTSGDNTSGDGTSGHSSNGR